MICIKCAQFQFWFYLVFVGVEVLSTTFLMQCVFLCPCIQPYKRLALSECFLFASIGINLSRIQDCQSLISNALFFPFLVKLNFKVLVNTA